MLNIYDGNNVMIRAMTSAPLPGQARLSLRQRLATAQPFDIWVWDGADHNKRRQEIYPEYKANRKPMAEDIYSQIRLFKAMLKHTPAVQLSAEGWEADDVIHTLAKGGSTMSIHTNDADYVQLLRYPNVTLVGVKKPPCEPEWLPLYKSLVGDPADNIKGIPGFGNKAWADTEGYRDELQAAIRVGSPHAFHVLPLPKPLLRWIDLPGSVATLQNMLLITNMWEVPVDDLHTEQGLPNPAIIDETLKKYFL